MWNVLSGEEDTFWDTYLSVLLTSNFQQRIRFGKPCFFLVPISPPVHFEGSKIRTLFLLDGRYLNSTFLGQSDAVNSICVQLNRAHSYKDAVEPEYVSILIVCQYMQSTCTVVCAEFVPSVFVLHFMPKNLHFACVHTVYRGRQRILRAYRHRTLSLFSYFFL